MTHSSSGGGGDRAGVSHWPELVGMVGSDAMARIQSARPGLKISLIPNGAMVTADFRQDRVR